MVRGKLVAFDSSAKEYSDDKDIPLEYVGKLGKAL